MEDWGGGGVWGVGGSAGRGAWAKFGTKILAFKNTRIIKSRAAGAAGLPEAINFRKLISEYVSLDYKARSWLQVLEQKY